MLRLVPPVLVLVLFSDRPLQPWPPVIEHILRLGLHQPLVIEAQP